MTDKILVTGAAGTVGTRVVKKLLERGGVKVLAATRHPDKLKNLAELGAEIVQADLNDPGSVDTVVGLADKLFFLTPADPNSVQQANNIISAAQMAKIKRVIRFSVLNAESDPGIVLTQMHRSTELGLTDSDLAWTFLRPNGFMQNFEDQAASIKERGEFTMALGDARVSIIDADDIADVAATILLDDSDEYSEKMYDLTGPAAIDNYEAAAAFSEVLDREIRYVPIEDETAANGMRQAGLPEPVVEAVIELYQAYRAGQFQEISGAVGAIAGHPPKSFKQYVTDNRAKYE